jgi:hypothetical protein
MYLCVTHWITASHAVCMGMQQKKAVPDGTAPPDKHLLLTLKDVTADLKDRCLQVFWEEDGGRWWEAQVVSVNVRQRKVTLLYKTGDPPLFC